MYTARAQRSILVIIIYMRVSYQPYRQDWGRELLIRLTHAWITDTTLYLCVHPEQNKTHSQDRGKELLWWGTSDLHYRKGGATEEYKADHGLYYSLAVGTWAIYLTLLCCSSPLIRTWPAQVLSRVLSEKMYYKMLNQVSSTSKRSIHSTLFFFIITISEYTKV